MSVHLSKLDETYARITCERDILEGLITAFTFEAKGYKFHPLYKKGIWDGMIRHVSRKDRKTYIGLENKVESWCNEHDIPFSSDIIKADNPNFSREGAKKFLESLGLPFKPHDHQIDAFHELVSEGRAILISPTASGKSLLAYALFRYYDQDTLVSVHRKSLVQQLQKHFREYGYKGEIQEFTGEAKDSEKKLCVATWQSVYKQPIEWYSRFKLVIGDEAHLFSAKNLVTILANLRNCENRFGLTGSLDGNESNEVLLEGLFGKRVQVTTTAELIEKGLVANLKIIIIRLHYSKAFAKTTLKKTKQGLKQDYHTERKVLLECDARRNFIARLTMSLQGSTLTLFERIDDGKELHAICPGSHIVYGAIEMDDRQKAIDAVANSELTKVIASFGTFAEGIDMPSLKHVIYGSAPGKARVRILQTIGRVLRKYGNKTATLWDVVDCLDIGNKDCYSVRHLKERLALYAEQGFTYEFRDIHLEVDDNGNAYAKLADC